MTGIGSRLTNRQARSFGSFELNGYLAPAKADFISERTSSGGSATDHSLGKRRQYYTDGVSGEYAGCRVDPVASNFTEGIAIAYIAWYSNTEVNNMNADYYIGFNDIDNTLSRVCFRPNVGEDTDGNVFVRDGAETYTGSVTYGSMGTPWSQYAILIDFDTGQSKFYINGNPLTSSPDETISAVPDTLDSVGAEIESHGGDSGEVMYVSYIAQRYIP